jgi:glucokinase
MFPVVAVDLGGTNIRAALFPSDQPQAANINRVLTHAEDGPEAVILRIIETIEALGIAGDDGLRMGVVAPGPLDPAQGVVFGAPNLPGWDRVPLRDRLAARFQCPVTLGNDCNLAALAEWRHGAGRGVLNLVFLAIGTGIGGGAIVNGQLLLGAHGLAAEFGHMLVDPNGPRCGCGQLGHLESMASGPAIGRRMAQQLAKQSGAPLDQTLELTAADVGQAAIECNALAQQVVQEAGTIIGKHLASLVHAFDPDRIVLGGGVSQLGDLILEPIRAAFSGALMHPAYRDRVAIVPAALGDDAGLIGAMLLAREF